MVEAGVLVSIVARRDLLRALDRDNADVEAKLRRLLDNYIDSRRQWTIEVTDDRVVVRGAFADEAEHRTIAALAHTIHGVDHVETINDAGSQAEHAAIRVVTTPRRRRDRVAGRGCRLEIGERKAASPPPPHSANPIHTDKRDRLRQRLAYIARKRQVST